jgi:hypothetical protein
VRDWFLTEGKADIMAKMMHVLKAAEKHLDPRIGFFDLLGFDFMVCTYLHVRVYFTHMSM